MAGASLLALIDDIASLLDDVAAMTKVATQKTAGILGDDLAVNAEQVTGVIADRELPVVFAVAKGSAKNKAILVPAALLISAVAPWAITPMLMLGGAYLCFEGVEKILHDVLHPKEEEEEHEELLDAVTDEDVDMLEFEKEKIQGAVRTDFILSAEIIVIALGTVAEVEFLTRVVVLVTVAIVMTIGVYGIVAAIVKLDDVGYHLTQRTARVAQRVGSLILAGAPYLMKGLGIAGTAAMFLVGGGIILHGLPGAAHLLHALPQEGAVGTLVGMLVNAIGGIIAGLLVVGIVTAFARLKARGRAAG